MTFRPSAVRWKVAGLAAAAGALATAALAAWLPDCGCAGPACLGAAAAAGRSADGAAPLCWPLRWPLAAAALLQCTSTASTPPWRTVAADEAVGSKACAEGATSSCACCRRSPAWLGCGGIALRLRNEGPAVPHAGITAASTAGRGTAAGGDAGRWTGRLPAVTCCWCCLWGAGDGTPGACSSGTPSPPCAAWAVPTAASAAASSASSAAPCSDTARSACAASAVFMLRRKQGLAPLLAEALAAAAGFAATVAA